MTNRNREACSTSLGLINNIVINVGLEDEEELIQEELAS